MSDPNAAERLAEHVDGWRKARAMAREMGVKASYTDECVDRLLLEIDRLTQERDAASDRATEIAGELYEVRRERDEARRGAEMLKARYGYTEPAIEAAERRGRQQATQPSADDVERAREVITDAIIDDENPAWNARTVQVILTALTAVRHEERQRAEDAIRACPSLDENGYICEKTAAIKAIQNGEERRLRALDEAVIEVARAVDTAWIEFSEHGNHNARLIIALYARLDDLHTTLTAARREGEASQL